MLNNTKKSSLFLKIQTEKLFEKMNDETLKYLKDLYENNDKSDFYNVAKKLKEFNIIVDENNFEKLYNIWISDKITDKIDILNIESSQNDEWEIITKTDIKTDNISKFISDFSKIWDEIVKKYEKWFISDINNEVQFVKNIDVKNKTDIVALLRWWESVEKYFWKVFKNNEEFEDFWDKKSDEEKNRFIEKFNEANNLSISIDDFNTNFIKKINFDKKIDISDEGKIIDAYSSGVVSKKMKNIKEKILNWEIKTKEQLFWWLKWWIIVKEFLWKNFLNAEQFSEYWSKNLSEKEKQDFIEKVKETQKIDLTNDSIMEDFIKNINFVNDYNKDEIKDIISLYHDINSKVYDWEKQNKQLTKKEEIKEKIKGVERLEKEETSNKQKELDNNNIVLINKISELEKLTQIDWNNVNSDIKELLEQEIRQIQEKNKIIEKEIKGVKENKAIIKEKLKDEYRDNNLVHFAEKTDWEKLQKVDWIFHKISTGKISTKEDLYFNTIWWEEINKFFHKQNPEEQLKLENEINELQNTRERVEEKLLKIEEKITSEISDIDLKIEEESAKLEPLEETISALQSSVEDENLTDEDRERIEKELSLANIEYSKAKLKVTNWQIEKAKKQRELNNYKNELDSIDIEINEKTNQLQKVSSFRDYDDFVEFLTWNHITDETEKEIFELEKKEFIKYLREKKGLNVDELSLAHYLKSVDFWLKLNDDEKRAISVEYKSKWVLARNVWFIWDEYKKKLSEWNLQVIDKIQQKIAEKTSLLEKTENPVERTKIEKEINILQLELDEKNNFSGFDNIKDEINTLETQIKTKQSEFNKSKDSNERWLIEQEIKELKTELWKKKHSLDMYRVDAISEVLTGNVSKRRNEILEQLENWEISLAGYEKMKKSLDMIKEKKSSIQQRKEEIWNLKDWNIKRFKSLQLQKEQIGLKREELKLDLWVANSLWPISILFYLVFNINQFVELGSFYFSYWIWITEFYINKYFFHFFAILIWYLSIVVFLSDWVESNYMLNPQLFSLYKFSSYNDFNISEGLKWWLIKLTITSLLIFVIYFYYQIILIIRLTVNSIKDDWKADVKFIFRWIWYLIITLFYFTAFFNYNL